jgi:hypothetical protein
MYRGERSIHQSLASNGQAHVRRLACCVLSRRQDAGGNALKTQLKQKMKQLCEERNIEWKPVEQEIDHLTSEELQEATEEPDTFLEQLVFRAARTVVLVALKDTVMPILEERQIPWEAVEKTCFEYDSIEELQSAVADPEALLQTAVQTQRSRW